MARDVVEFPGRTIDRHWSSALRSPSSSAERARSDDAHETRRGTKPTTRDEVRMRPCPQSREAPRAESAPLRSAAVRAEPPPHPKKMVNGAGFASYALLVAAGVAS